MEGPTISYCLNNVGEETRRALRSCGLPVLEDCCLQRCGPCYEGPFLLLEDKLIAGASHDALLAALLAADGAREE